MTQTLRKTSVADLILWHDVSSLGPGVADNVATLIRRYMDQAGIGQLPPITLSGSGWDAPWEALATVSGCSGCSGPSDAELMEGGQMYQCLTIRLPEGTTQANLPHTDTIEGVIAHEIAHLRWPSLKHGVEFYARVIALLKGATFPSKGGWGQSTKQAVKQARLEAQQWLSSVLRIKPEL